MEELSGRADELRRARVTPTGVQGTSEGLTPDCVAPLDGMGREQGAASYGSALGIAGVFCAESPP